MIVHERLQKLHDDWYQDQCDPGHVISLIKVVILMADQLEQLSADVAAQKQLVTGTLTDVSAAIGGLQTSVAALTAQLAAIGTGGPLPDISSQLADIEANTATVQKVKDAADAAIAALTPPSPPASA